MTRFARGKSSHQRVAGDSTPWTDLKTTPAKEGRGGGGASKNNQKQEKGPTTAGPTENSEGKSFKKGGGGGGGDKKFQQGKNRQRRTGGGGNNRNNRKSGGGQNEESANFTPLGGRDKNVNVKGQGQSKVVKIFGNFWVGEEDARRLQGLVKKLKAEGLSRKDILDALQNERRRAEKAAKRRRDKICFNCRQFGHVLADCPKGNNNNTEGGDGDDNVTGRGDAEICFKCGSTEHTSRSCRKKADTFQFAKCFVCQQSGHIARQCPSNTKGIYPTGGSCDECGSISHLKKDCPDVIGVDSSAGHEDSVVARITDPFVSPEAEDFTLENESQNPADAEEDTDASSLSRSKGASAPAKRNPKKVFKNQVRQGKRKFEDKDSSSIPTNKFEPKSSSVQVPSSTNNTSVPVQKKRKVVKF